MEKSERKSRTSRLRRIELSIWLFIFLVITAFAVFLFYKHEESFEYHRIKMPDVDGLIVGSPVNLMGIPVGYVTKTKIMNDDEVLVKFKLTNRDIKVPKGTVATVEFSGLGGSKSLELYPPSNNKTVTKELLVNKYDDYILVERPKRLRDCWTLLYQMYQKIVAIAYNLSAFGQELNSSTIMPSVSNTIDTVNFINYADNWLDNSHNNMKNFRKILEYKGNNK